MRTDIYGILKAELQPQSTVTQFAVRAGRKTSAGRNVSEQVDGSLEWIEVKRNVMFQPSYISAVLKIRSKDHDDSVASGAFNQSGVGRIYVDV